MESKNLKLIFFHVNIYMEEKDRRHPTQFDHLFSKTKVVRDEELHMLTNGIGRVVPKVDTDSTQTVRDSGSKLYEWIKDNYHD
jgi:hypothetical protein